MTLMWNGFRIIKLKSSYTNYIQHATVEKNIFDKNMLKYVILPI